MKPLVGFHRHLLRLSMNYNNGTNNDTDDVSDSVYDDFAYINYAECCFGVLFDSLIIRIIVKQAHSLCNLSPTSIYLLDNFIGDIIYLLSLVVALILSQTTSTAEWHVQRSENILPPVTLFYSIFDYINTTTFMHSIFVYTFLSVQRYS
jgi:hypothetical protein